MRPATLVCEEEVQLSMGDGMQDFRPNVANEETRRRVKQIVALHSQVEPVFGRGVGGAAKQGCVGCGAVEPDHTEASGWPGSHIAEELRKAGFGYVAQ